MYKPVLSIDVSKSKSCAAAFLDYGEPYLKPFVFSHSPEGTAALVSKLTDLEKCTGIKPDVVLEATGNFSKPISNFFEREGFNVIVLNPLRTHQRKNKSIRKIKTDPVDANRIAQVYYLEKCLPNSVVSELSSDIRNLCRQLDGFNTMFTETQIRFRCILDLIFPNYDTIFNHVCCKSSLNIINNYPSPQSVLTADREDLIRIIKSSGLGYPMKWIEERVDKLIAAAGESLPSKEAQQSNTKIIKHYVRMLMTHMDVMAQIRAQIIAQASLSPVYPLLRSIPGVGELTAATIIGEIGDISRFDSVKKLVAFSGLDPSVYESGKFKSSNNKITKRGSSYLRKALYQATVAGISNRKNGPINPVLYGYYTKKLSEGKAPKVAIVAASNKLLHIIYGIWRSGNPFVNVH